MLAVEPKLSVFSILPFGVEKALAMPTRHDGWSLKVYLSALIAFCFSGSIQRDLWASDDDPPARSSRLRYDCHWAKGAIAIDGKGDEPDWKRATTIDRFVVPGTLQNAQKGTRAKLLWDRNYLYFLAELEDQDLFADVVEHDGKTWDNDVFEMFLKPSLSAPGYYEFQVNAAGTEMDLFLPDQKSGGYTALKSSHPFHWMTKVERRGTLNVRSDSDEGWTVEGRIPWADFLMTGGRPDIDEVWTMALCRYDYTLGKKPELSSCANLTQPNFHRTEDYLELRFSGRSESDEAFKRLRQGKHHLSSRVVGSPEPPLPYQTVRAYPELMLEWPIDVQVEPGSHRLLIIEEQGAYGPTTIVRTVGPPELGKLERLIDPQGVAYSICFHPRFEENGFFYVGSNGKREGEKHHSRVVRYQLSRTEPYPLVGEPLTIIEWESNGHNGAAITFGLDGMMYVTSGDGTSDSDANNVGQDLSTLLAKVLRIDVDHPAKGVNYSIPEGNPFLGTSGARQETWAYGLRNPWRITTDKKTGHVWVGNNGQDMWEQVYRIEKGANYGWSVFEGGHPFYAHRQLGPTPHVKPTVEHPHSESRSLTGGAVYHGQLLPDLRGAYIYGDYSTGKIWGVKHDGTKVIWHRELADTPLQISAIALDADGELLVVDHRGEKKGGLYRLTPTVPSPSAETFPRWLSQTGLFESVAGHRPAEGTIPYSVNAQLWSDGAQKTRFIALPEGGSIEPTDQWAWQFPDHTVLVKSFAIDRVEGDPASRVWIETRLMVKQQGEWVGYSYEWNDEQTDAKLVEAEGRDREFTIRGSNSARTQRWHYPSRTECMVCHTRAAGFVLGLSTVQLNKLHDYQDGRTLPQLEALEEMNVLKISSESQWKESLRKEMLARGIDQASIDRDLHK